VDKEQSKVTLCHLQMMKISEMICSPLLGGNKLKKIKNRNNENE
jgi:hypothetical protein